MTSHNQIYLAALRETETALGRFAGSTDVGDQTRDGWQLEEYNVRAVTVSGTQPV